MISTIGKALIGSLAGVAVIIGSGCQGNETMRIENAAWGEVDGKAVELYTLDNGNGMIATITNYGGIVTQLIVPDGRGGAVDVALGFDTLEEYVDHNPYFGAMVGRVGNRIDEGRFEVDGVVYQVATNNGPNHLHGGVKGFDKVVWDAELRTTSRGPSLRLTYTSPDGEERYPGTLNVIVDYVLTHDNELKVDIFARTDKATPVNIVHHTYWNLAGHASGTILEQELQVHASKYTPVDATLIPTGVIAPVAGTAFDFMQPKAIGADIGDLPSSGDDPGGYDLNYVVDGHDGSLRRNAVARDPQTGLTMEVWSTMPGIQFYSGNFLDGVAGKGGASYAKHTGFCLETQFFPDAVNKYELAGWPDPVLHPGQTYRHVMVHRFAW